MREGTEDIPAGGRSVWRRIFEKSPELSALIVDTAGAVAILDANLAITYRNAALDELLAGHELGECTSLPFGCDDCRKQFTHGVRSALAGQSVSLPKLCLASPSGGNATVSARLIGLKSRKGTEFAVAFITDRTDLAMLKERVAFLDEFAQIGLALPAIGHKMNNHLAAILGFSKLLMNSGQPAQGDLQTILDAGAQCRHLTDRYFRFSSERCKAGLIDANNVVRSALALVRGDLASQKISCTLNLEQHLPPVNVASIPLEQAILNIVNRARRAMPTGGTLVIESRTIMAQRPARPGSDAPAGPTQHVEVTIADSGPEIVEPELSAIFEPISFSSTTGRQIGLVGIARVLVNHQRASLGLVSTSPKGSTFAIRVPAHEQIAVRERKVRPPAPRSPRTAVKTIIVVDDDEMCRKLLAEALARDGHFVDTADDGEAALARVERTAYDAIIADIRMPGMGGDGFYAEIARRFPELAPRVIFITGDSISADTQEFLSKLPNPCLTKPFAMEELLVAVKNL
ncbi:MAG TPA: response regulator [Planctomycetota bacterium]|nr:response regulator [Planctomycetota bacterium]